MRILVTGGAGFIGSHVCEALLARGDRVRVLDNLDPFYAPATKQANLDRLARAAGDDEAIDVRIADLRDVGAVGAAVEGIDAVVHLAALAGVRPSIERPAEYWDVNLVGTQRLLDAIAPRGLGLVFGSSSSIYGGSERVPFREDDPVDAPISPYAATKRAGELCCHTHHVLHGGDVTCLRFFTVYGPRQRPEMAIHAFTRRIAAGEAIPCFGDGSSSRDYTYVSDIVAGVLAALDRLGGFRIYNLGGSRTTTLRELVATIAGALGREARIETLPDQAGDVPRTWADIDRARAELGYAPAVSIDEGIPRFVAWYLEARALGEVG